MEMKKVIMSAVLVVAVLMATISPSASHLNANNLKSAGMRMLLNFGGLNLEGTGDGCPGSFCLDDIRSCALGYGCLVVPPIYAGHCSQ